jgi:hypothetical protein
MRLILALFAAASLAAFADSPPGFRTDAQGPYTPDEIKKLGGKEKNSVLQWFQLVDGEFPPPGSAHAISGELIRVDHLERRFHLRVDRSDSQGAGNLDLPIDATMLPYGAIWYHGAPAALQDIPLGTHLRGLFFSRPAGDKTPPAANLNLHGRQSSEIEFNRCFELEDDFSHHQRAGERWKIEAVDLEKRKLTVRLHRKGQAVGEPKVFDLQESTLVHQGRAFAELNALQPGQQVLFNLTWATLFGPGRLLDVWVDEESRGMSATQQTRRHHDHLRERGLPGWIEAVDDKAEVVTLTFFNTFDPVLFADLNLSHEDPIGWPLTREPKDPKAPKGTIAVTRESLLMWDPLNDRHGGSILSVDRFSPKPGEAGVRIRVQCDILLEGFRRGRIVRFFPAAWRVKFPPLEEAFRSY